MKHLYPALKMLLTMIILTGLIYPLLVTAIAQLVMPKKANGSLIKVGNQMIGSELIAQNFKNEAYFWPRPSAINYDPLRPSGGSNLGPTSHKLKEIVEARVHALLKTQPNALSFAPPFVPPGLVYASGSGLDPHITLDAAYFQIERIAQARAISTADQNKITDLINSRIEGQQLGFIGPLYVNVLLLNQLLDEHFPFKHR